ncbi:NFATC2-interacting protein-like [Bolinopsis microptera]|uniref:NFATC2-interacting protein-like n=1 Tax=Bolinopsis microptera TaxID=2820187 RepID=UPI00307A6395
MTDSGSSDDDLGLFSFANKRTIVSTPPTSPTNSEKDETESPVVNDRSLFMRKNKRKRLNAPHIIDEADNQTGNENDVEINSMTEDSTAMSEKIRHYDNIVANICDIDPVANAIQVQPTKKFKKIAEKREQLIHNIDGVLNKFKSKINTVEEDLPHSSYVVADDNVRADRPFMLKMRKGSNLHRFKIKTDTPLKTVLDHLAPEYNVKPELFILQLNDETLDPLRTPNQLGLTVVDIIDVLVGSVPQSTAAQVQIVDRKNVIKIKVQSTDFRNNTREYEAIKTKPLVECLFEACQDFGYQAAKYFFDGDAIDPRKTPMELELEDDDCLDIVEQT